MNIKPMQFGSERVLNCILQKEVFAKGHY